MIKSVRMMAITFALLLLVGAGAAFWYRQQFESSKKIIGISMGMMRAGEFEDALEYCDTAPIHHNFYYSLCNQAFFGFAVEQNLTITESACLNIFYQKEDLPFYMENKDRAILAMLDVYTRCQLKAEHSID